MVLAETRTTAGTTKVFGGPMPAAVLYIKRDFIEKNPNTVQALVNAFYKTLKWMEKATPEQIADAVPEEFWLGDKALYVAAVKASLDVYSARRHRQRRRARSARSISCSQFDKEIADAKVDTAKTWDDPLRQEGGGSIGRSSVVIPGLRARDPSLSLLASLCVAGSRQKAPECHRSDVTQRMIIRAMFLPMIEACWRNLYSRRQPQCAWH